MLDIEGIVLNKILEVVEGQTTGNLEGFSALKEQYFSEGYKSIYTMMQSHHSKFGKVPNFTSLEVLTGSPKDYEALLAIKSIEVPEGIAIEEAVASLKDNYIRLEYLNLNDKVLADLNFMDGGEIINNITELARVLDGKLDVQDSVFNSKDIQLFQKKEELTAGKIPCGVSNEFDSIVGGFYKEDLILIGGHRGAGKSVYCCNLVASQYNEGIARTKIDPTDGSVTQYFTIEMTKEEIDDRIMCILAQVSAIKKKKGELDRNDILALAKVRAAQVIDGDLLYKQLVAEEIDEFVFEDSVRMSPAIPTNQIIVIDDADLTMAKIDNEIHKAKMQHGDRLRLVVIDYINQITIGNNADKQYDWKEQGYIGKGLKSFARQHDVIIVSPYQVTDKGEVRFAKSIQDACDMAMVINADDDGLTSTCVKARSAPDGFKFRNLVNWDTLTIDPSEAELLTEGNKEEEEEPEYRKKARGVSDI